MAVDLIRRPLTVEQFNRMIESGIIPENDRVELIEGDIVEMAPIGARHASSVSRVVDVFRAFPPGPAILLVQSPIELTEITRVEPDVALVQRRPDFYRARLPRAVEVFLAVEVADSSIGYDRTVKVPAFARAGVPEAWLVDIAANRVEVYRTPALEGYLERRIVSPDDDDLSILALPGLRVSARALVGPTQ